MTDEELEATLDEIKVGAPEPPPLLHEMDAVTQPAPDAAAIREAALREAAALCDKPHHEGGVAKSLAFFARIANHAFYRQGCEEYRDAILALITEKPHDRA